MSPEYNGTLLGTKVIRKVSSLINFKLLSFLVKKKGEKYVDFWVKLTKKECVKVQGRAALTFLS